MPTLDSCPVDTCHELPPLSEDGSSLAANSPLDGPLTEWEGQLQQILTRMMNHYVDLDRPDARPAHNHGGVEAMRTRLDEPMPESAMSWEALWTEIEDKVISTATLTISPQMHAYVSTCGSQAGIAAEWLSAALHQNGAKWHLGPGLAEMEQRVVQWMAQFIGYPTPCAGMLVSGGTAANLNGLHLARNWKLGHTLRQHGLYQTPPMTVYTSTEVHACADKSMEQLGLGLDHLRKIPTRPDFTIDVDRLRRQIEEDRANGLLPGCIIANGGTVNTGAIDPLNELADLCDEFDMWLHVDGAYGALAAACPETRSAFFGLERAHSVAMDAHKWLYAPYEGGCLVVRDWDTLQQTFTHRADYLASDQSTVTPRRDLTDYSFQLSRNFKALKVWMIFKAYGAQGLRNAIADNMAVSRYLAAQVDHHPDFERVAPVPLSVVCFRYTGNSQQPSLTPDQVDRLNQELVPALEADGRVFITGTRIHGRPALRACNVNHRTRPSTMDQLLTIIEEVGRPLRNSILTP